MFSSAVSIDLTGAIDQQRLTALRASLRLEPEGRLGDAYDQVLGTRRVETPGGRLELVLYRDDLDGPWALRLNVERDPSADAVDALVDEAVAAARATGLDVAGVRRRDRTGGGGSQ